MSTETTRDMARRLVDGLSDDAGRDDLMRLISVRQAIDAGLEDAKAGRTVDLKQVRERFGLKP